MCKEYWDAAAGNDVIFEENDIDTSWWMRNDDDKSVDDCGVVIGELKFSNILRTSLSSVLYSSDYSKFVAFCSNDSLSPPDILS